MSITENFLVNTKNFEAIIEELRTTSNLPDKITSNFLEKLGYSNPSDLLVLHLFKDLNMLDDDGSATPLFEKFRKEDTSKKAMARGVVEAYSELFKSNTLVYKLKADELKEEFKKFFGSSKSDLILKYMANTFATLVDYAGVKNIEAVSEEYLEKNKMSGVEEVIREVAEKQNNGASKSSQKVDDEVAVAEEEEETEEQINAEEKGETGIEDIIGPASGTSETEFETEEEDEDEEADDDSVVEAEADAEVDLNDDDEVLELDSDSDSDLESDSEDSDELDVVEHVKNESEDDDEEIESRTEEPEEEELPETVSVPEKTEEIEEFESETEESDEDPFGLKDTTNSKDKPMETANISTSTNDKKYVDKAFLKKAELLYKLEKFEEALPAFKQVIDRYGDSEDPYFSGHVSKAVIRRAAILDELERYDEALPAFDEVYERFEDSDKSEYYKEASNALIKKIEIMEMLDLDDQVESLYPTVINRLGKSDEPRFAKYVDKAYISQTEKLMDADDPRKAIEAINGVIDRFKGSGKHDAFLEKAMYVKAELLEQLGEDEEALKAYEDVLNAFGNQR